MDLYIARQPATQTTRKADLMDACRVTSIEARPNWAHPNPREFLVQLNRLAEMCGCRVGDPLPHPLVPGAKTTYTTAKSWPITHVGSGDTVVITWDSQAGDIQGNLRGSHWKTFAELMPDVVDQAYESAEVIHNNVIDQIAISLMLSFPAAPFVSSGLPGKQRNSLWLAVPADYQCRVETFFAIIGRPLLDGMIVSPNGFPVSDVSRLRIERSCERGCKRLARGSGWVKICKESHSALLASLA